MTRSDGHDVRLEEDPDLQLPFLLPEDGYSCDVVQGLPSGLTEFLQTLEREGKENSNPQYNYVELHIAQSTVKRIAIGIFLAGSATRIDN